MVSITCIFQEKPHFKLFYLDASTIKGFRAIENSNRLEKFGLEDVHIYTNGEFFAKMPSKDFEVHKNSQNENIVYVIEVSAGENWIGAVIVNHLGENGELYGEIAKSDGDVEINKGVQYTLVTYAMIKGVEVDNWNYCEIPETFEATETNFQDE